MFTLPALFMLDAKMRAETGQGIDFSVWPLLLGGLAGSILGVVLIIPLRKQMIDLDRLKFPSGVAVATILQTGSSGIDKFKLLVMGVFLSGLWKLVMILGLLDKPGVLMHEELNISFGIIPDQFSPVIYLSLMNAHT